MSGELVDYKEKQTSLQKTLDKWEPYMTSNLCPAHVSAPRIIGAVVMAARSNPKLLDCPETSVLRTVIQCCQYGLEPDTPLQQCHILVYSKEAKLIVGYRGLIALAYNTGLVAGITAIPVYMNERFEYRMTAQGAVLDHVPMLEGDKGGFRAVYCMIKLVDAQADVIIQVMSKEQVDHIMMKSPSRNSDKSPWKQDYDQMAIKTVIKRALKYMPLSPEKAERLMSAVAHDNAVDIGQKSIDETTAQQIIDTEGEVINSESTLTEPSPDEDSILEAYKNPPAAAIASWAKVDSRYELSEALEVNCIAMKGKFDKFQDGLNSLGIWPSDLSIELVSTYQIKREALEIMVASSEIFLANNCGEKQ